MTPGPMTFWAASVKPAVSRSVLPSLLLLRKNSSSIAASLEIATYPPLAAQLRVRGADGFELVGIGMGSAGAGRLKILRPRNSRSVGGPPCWFRNPRIFFKAVASCSGFGDPMRKSDGGESKPAGLAPRDAFS